MKKWIFLICLLFSCESWIAARSHTDGDTLTQIFPDIEAVRLAVQNPESPCFYPRLIARYMQRDTTLTTEEYRYLYLGYSFQDDYDPYRVSSYEMSLDTLYRRNDLTAAECEKLIRYAGQVLADNPFDLRRMAVLVYANTMLGNHAEVNFWQTRIHHLVDAILSTGDGRTPETAWYVIEPVHAYDILNTLGVVAEAYEFEPPCYDYIQVYDLIGNARGFYFNVSRILEEYQRKFGTE